MPPSTALTRYLVRSFGGPERLELITDEPLPEPRAGEVCIQVEACSVQFTDTIIRRGFYRDAGRPPLTPGYDVVGRITKAGAGVTDFAVGDRVADLILIGGYASHVVRPTRTLVRVPESLDAAEASALILSGVTAWQMLTRHAHVAPEARVLIQGGNGAVGFFAVQFARQLGARVWTTARPAHHEALRALGAEPLDYRDAHYPERLREATGGGVDHVFDGEGADGYGPSLRCLRKSGQLTLIGASRAIQRGKSMYVAGARVMLRNLNPFGPRVSFYSITKLLARHPDWFKQDLASLFAQLSEGKIAVRIAERVGFAGVPEAHRALERGGVSGKIVLLPDS